MTKMPDEMWIMAFEVAVGEYGYDAEYRGSSEYGYTKYIRSDLCQPQHEVITDEMVREAVGAVARAIDGYTDDDEIHGISISNFKTLIQAAQRQPEVVTEERGIEVYEALKQHYKMGTPYPRRMVGVLIKYFQISRQPQTVTEKYLADDLNTVIKDDRERLETVKHLAYWYANGLRIVKDKE